MLVQLIVAFADFSIFTIISVCEKAKVYEGIRTHTPLDYREVCVLARVP